MIFDLYPRSAIVRAAGCGMYVTQGRFLLDQICRKNSR